MEGRAASWDFVTAPPDHLVCRICLQVFQDPHLTSCCGNHFCQSCVSRSLRGSQLCPLCNSTFTVFRAQNVIREVNALVVRCPNATSGCHWTGPLSNQDDHLLNCGYVNVLCPQGCGAYTQLRLLQKHHDILCPMRRSECDYCQQYEGTYKDLQETHWKVCKDFPVPCPNNCPHGSIPRGRLTDHLKNDCRVRQQLTEVKSPDSLQAMQRELEAQVARIRQLEATVRDQEGIIGQLRVKLKEKEEKLQPVLLHHSDSEPNHSFKSEDEEEKRLVSGLNPQPLNNLDGEVTEDNFTDTGLPPDCPRHLRQRHSEPGLYHRRVSQGRVSQERVLEKRVGSADLMQDSFVSPLTPQGHHSSPSPRSDRRQRRSAPPRMPGSSRMHLYHRNSGTGVGTNGQRYTHSPSYSEQKEMPQGAYPGMSVKWETCHDLPEVMFDGNAVLVGGFVYAGGGSCQRTGSYQNECTVFGYDNCQDSWFRLPPIARHKFSLVAYLNQLVLVGGATPGGRAAPADCLRSLAVWDQTSHGWIEPYPPMHTSRVQPSTVAYKQYIAVAGGRNQEDLNSTEIFNGNDEQWSFTISLPKRLYCASSLLDNGYWYLLGGRGRQKRAVYFASLESLIKEATGREPRSRTADSDSTWKTLPDTDFNLASIVSVNGHILAIGGAKNPFGVTNAVHVFSNSTRSWVPVECPLPVAFSSSATVVIPPRDVLVVGGCSDLARYKHVFKGAFNSPSM